jgi:hypothetical protein
MHTVVANGQVEREHLQLWNRSERHGRVQQPRAMTTTREKT